MSNSRAEKLREAFAVLDPQRLEIEDEGHLHAGHAGAAKGGHFRILIVSSRFAGQPPIKRHRMVYEAAGNLMQTDIHALSIVARTPEEVATTMS